MVIIYVIKCQWNKYYIGKSNKLEERILQHFNNLGSDWTKMYNPISVEQIYENCDNFDEDKYTIKYMEKYGINNVRGGSFCQINLSEEKFKLILEMIRGASDKCFICGSQSHFAKKCPNDYNKFKNMKVFCENFEEIKCHKCGQIGHWKNECNLEKNACHCCGSLEHIKKNCPQINKQCFICGKTGHLKFKCQMN